MDRILLNQVERERGRKGIRNVAALKIEKSKNENEKARNIWKTPYFTNNAHIVKDDRWDSEYKRALYPTDWCL